MPSGRLARIGTPTRVLWGAHDPVLKVSWTDRLGEFFSDLQVGVAPDAGHFVHLECPDLATDAIGAAQSVLASTALSEHMTIQILDACAAP